MEPIILSVLLFGSVVGLAFIIERGLALRAARVCPAAVENALANFRTPADLPMLIKTCQQHPSTLSRLLLLAEERRSWSKDENSSGLETFARQEISKLERGLVILEIIIGTAPLLGLVGTVYGLIALFATLGTAGISDNNRLASGIALALNATLLGLITAIPSLVAWSYYSKKVEHYSVKLAALCDGFVRQLYFAETETDVRSPAKSR